MIRGLGGEATAWHFPLTTTWLLLPNQGRKTLSEVMSWMKTNKAKRQVLQTLPGMYPRNALLFKWGPSLTPSPACTLCGHAAETQTRVQCVCPSLK